MKWRGALRSGPRSRAPKSRLVARLLRAIYLLSDDVGVARVSGQRRPAPNIWSFEHRSRGQTATPRASGDRPPNVGALTTGG